MHIRTLKYQHVSTLFDSPIDQQGPLFDDG